jgi:hypothetical protein
MPSGVQPAWRQNVSTASGLTLIAGIWLIVSPFILGYADVQHALGNDMIVGGVVAILAALRLGAKAETAWAGWMDVLLGVWLIVAPFVLGYTARPNALWNNVILGAVIAALAVWSAASTPRRNPGF